MARPTNRFGNAGAVASGASTTTVLGLKLGLLLLTTLGVAAAVFVSSGLGECVGGSVFIGALAMADPGLRTDVAVQLMQTSAPALGKSGKIVAAIENQRENEDPKEHETESLKEHQEPTTIEEALTFSTAKKKVGPFTMVQAIFLKMAWEYLTQSGNTWKKVLELRNDIPPEAGDVVECGVWSGGSSMLMAYAQLAHEAISVPSNNEAPAIRFWLFDTFEGLPPPDATKDDPQAIARYKGVLSLPNNSDSKATSSRGSTKINGVVRWNYAPLDQVQKHMESTGVLPERVSYVKGKVEDTLYGREQNLPTRIAVLRLDTDWYNSTKAELDVLFPLLVPGGLFLIDDYCYWAGARDATDEWLKDHSESITIISDVCKSKGRSAKIFVAIKKQW